MTDPQPNPVAVTYNRIAGQNVERLSALSDGIFGVAMTLLLLELHVPAKALIHSETDLWLALAGMLPQLLVYLMSFITLGIFWVGQQIQLDYMARSERHLTWMHLIFLFAVTILPFSTRLLAEFITYRAALLTYWCNLVLLGGMLRLCWGRAIHQNLVRPEVTQAVRLAICRRIVFAQALYAFGAALCIFNPYWSIGFIVLVQLNYAFAPWHGHRRR